MISCAAWEAIAWFSEENSLRAGTGCNTTVCVQGPHMTSGLDVPNGLTWQRSEPENSYPVRDAAMAASAFAITASARSVAARSSSLFQISTEWPSSNDSSVASCVRESNSRSAAMASQSSLISSPFREDWVISITPSYPSAIALAEEIVLASERHRSNRAVDGLRVKFDAVLMEEAGQSIPVRQCITDRFSEIAAAGQLRKLHLQLEAKAVNDRLGECAPHRQPMRRRLTTQLRFEGIEASDAPQGLVRDGHVLGLRNFVELVPGVRPTRGEDDVSGVSQPTESRVSVDVQKALEVRQMRSRALRLAVGREHINCSRRLRSSQAPLIVGIHPQPSRLGAPSARGRERRTAWIALFTNLMESMRRSKC